ncbi:MAG: hypothetical protein IKE58_08360 [Blautia sp.]|nr:hypothetical protein [Blautia sp.]
MTEDTLVLCGASSYEQKYYFNPKFGHLPDHVKEELQILCVSFTEEVGGIFTLEFDREGTLTMKTRALDSDAMYDDIGAGLRIKELRRRKEELFRSLELYYRLRPNACAINHEGGFSHGSSVV